MDLAKTQFLMEPTPYGGHRIRTFKRKSALVLFAANGQPIRPITWAGWCKLKADWPAQVDADGLTVRTVWSLVEVD
jgi:hypothetical protein